MPKTNTRVVQRLNARMTALKSLPLNVALCLFLLFAQAVDFAHGHDADLQSRLDCEICLKVASLDDMVASGSTNLVTLVSGQSFSVLTQSQIFSAPATTAARAPPSYT